MVQMINISVFSPGIGKKFDFSIPANMCIKNAVELIVKIISEEFSGVNNSSMAKHSLIKQSTGEILNESFNLLQSGIFSGDKFILV